MSKSKHVKQIAIYLVLILLGMLISTTLLSSRATGPRNETEVAKQPLASARQAYARPTGPDAEVWTMCTPLDVAAFSNRIHVRCAESVGGIYFFAASTANPAHAARVLSILSTAHAAGRTIDILYDPDDTSGTSIGCQANDCRLISAASFRQ
jgi:hypothetical protein